MIQIQDMLENGKPVIVLKTVKGFNTKRTSFIILIPENSFKLGIDEDDIGWDLCPFLTLSVRNGPSVSYGTNVS